MKLTNLDGSRPGLSCLRKSIVIEEKGFELGYISMKRTIVDEITDIGVYFHRWSACAVRRMICLMPVDSAYHLEIMVLPSIIPENPSFTNPKPTMRAI